MLYEVITDLTNVVIVSSTVPDPNPDCPRCIDTDIECTAMGPTALSASVVAGQFSNEAVVSVQASGAGNFVYWMDEGLLQYNGYFTNVTSGEHTIFV